MIECDQIIASANMGIADIDLWNGTTPGFFHHLGAQFRIEIDTGFLDLSNAPIAQQLFCTYTVRAHGG